MIPARQRSNVDLPDPLGPSTATTSPPRICRDSPSRATVCPNRFDTPSATSSGPSTGLCTGSVNASPSDQFMPQAVDAPCGQLDPPKVGLQVEQLEVTCQRVGQVARPLAPGQVSHPNQV